MRIFLHVRLVALSSISTPEEWQLIRYAPAIFYHENWIVRLRYRLHAKELACNRK